MKRTRTPSVFLATILAGLLLTNGCGGGGTTSIPIPPSLPDISGTYLLNFGTGPSGALALASLTVTLKQTEWLNDINMLSISSGQLLVGCPGFTNQTINISAHLEWNGQQEKFVLSIDTSAGQNFLMMTDDNFVAPYSGAWTPGAAFPPCNGQVAPPYSWTGVKQ
jgi:hypothetical protein